MKMIIIENINVMCVILMCNNINESNINENIIIINNVCMYYY